MDKALKKTLLQYATLFQDGRQRNINEADTVMYLTKFFTDVLGYDLFSEITKEFQVRDRYCDVAIKVKGEVKFLVEAKAMPIGLSDKHIEQAENYASRAGIRWVVLTSGISWRLYHLTFDQRVADSAETMRERSEAPPCSCWIRRRAMFGGRSRNPTRSAGGSRNRASTMLRSSRTLPGQA